MRTMDTSPEIEEIQIEIFRKMEPERKLSLVFQLMALEKEIMIEGIRNRHPEYTDQEVKLAFIRLSLGDVIFEKVYPGYKNIKP